MDLEEMGINAGNWVDSAQDRNYWRTLVNEALNLRVPLAMELFGQLVNNINSNNNIDNGRSIYNTGLQETSFYRNVILLRRTSCIKDLHQMQSTLAVLRELAHMLQNVSFNTKTSGFNIPVAKLLNGLELYRIEFSPVSVQPNKKKKIMSRLRKKKKKKQFVSLSKLEIFRHFWQNTSCSIQ